MAEIGAISQIYEGPKYGNVIGRNFVCMISALFAFAATNAAPVYWLSAVQDGSTVVYWVSFTVDTSGAPAGHTYTDLTIEASWLL